MRNHIIIFLAFYSSIILGQNFEKEVIFDTEFHSVVIRTVEDKQQDIIVSGFSFDTAWHCAGTIYKITAEFDTISKIICNDTADIIFRDVLVTPENNYWVIGGIGRDTGYYIQADNIAIYIFDQNLNLITNKSYQMPAGYKNPKLFLWQSLDGKIYAAGGEGSSSTKLLLLKFNQNGDLILSNFPWQNNAFIYNVLPKPDNLSGFYAFGDGFSIGMGRMEVDTNLNYTIESIDDNMFLGGFSHSATAKWLNDTVFLFSSEVHTDTIGTPYPYEDNVLIKIDADLEVSSDYITVGIPSTRDFGLPYNIDWNSTDKMYVGTFDAYSFSGEYRYFIALFNDDLEILGTKIISGGEEIDYSLWNICATSDGGLICTGPCRKYGALNYDIDVFVHKFMPEDIVQVAEKTANPYDSDYFVYPNPGADKLNVITARKGVSLAIYNEGGQIVEKVQLNDGFNNTISTISLMPGIYFLHFTDDKGYTEIVKWIKN